MSKSGSPLMQEWRESLTRGISRRCSGIPRLFQRERDWGTPETTDTALKPLIKTAQIHGRIPSVSESESFSFT